MRASRSVDMYFSSAGDFVLDENRHDFADTQNHSMRDLIQRMYTRIISSPRSWRLQQDIGAGLDQFLGRANTERTGQEIRQAIIAALIAPGFLKPQEIKVEVFPLTERTIAVLVEAAPSGSTEVARLNFTLDLRDGEVVMRNL